MRFAHIDEVEVQLILVLTVQALEVRDPGSEGRSGKAREYKSCRPVLCGLLEGHLADIIGPGAGKLAEVESWRFVTFLQSS